MNETATDYGTDEATGLPLRLANELASIAAEAESCTFFLQDGHQDLDYALRTLDYAATHIRIAQQIIEKMGGTRDGI